MRAVLIVAVLLISVFAPQPAQAWWCTGHMIIAEIARQNLESGIGDKVDKHFTFLNQWFEQTDNMVSGACWADDLKSDKLEVMEGWHFINQPYNPDKIEIHPWPIQKVNVETNIMSLSETIKRDKSREWITAFAVANLVHFYGDIHQPLHATEMFDSAYPHGDGGGTELPVYMDGAKWTLHFVWDSVCGLYQNEPKRPLNSSAYDYIQNLAQQYTANFSIPDNEKKVFNSTVMAQESFDDAVHYAYVGNTIKPHSNLTDAYLEKCKSVAGYRLVTAGYRLASQLNYLFKSETSAEAMLSSVQAAKEEYRNAAIDRGLHHRHGHH